MDTAKIRDMLLSQQAIVGYEIVILILLLAGIVVLSRKQKARKQQKEMLRIQKEKEQLDDALANQKRR